MIRYALFCILALSATLCAATANLPIDTSKNHLEFPAGNASFAPFLRKLDSLAHTGKGTVNILHLGGSHIQADIISNRVRSHLIQDLKFPAAGRGYVFPYTAARTNTPISYASRRKGHFKWLRSVRKDRKYKLGLMGFEVTTIDPEAEVRIVLDSRIPNEKFWYFTEARIFGYSPNSIEPVLQLDSNGTRYFGKHDSLSNSFTFQLPRRADSLILTFPWKDSLAQKFLQDTLSKLDSLKKDSLFADTNFFDSQPSFTLTGILLTDTVPGIVYNSIGVNGADLEAYLSLENMESDLKFSPPDLVILAIGVNDANVDVFDPELFKARYDTLIARIKSVSPKTSFIFVSNNDNYNTQTNKPNSNGALVVKACKELAKKYKGGFWDMYGVMGGFKSIETWTLVDYAKKDHVHFTNAGYELLGDLYYDALKEVLRPDAPKVTTIPKDLPVKNIPSKPAKATKKRKAKK
ncbi:MAG: hypothetical protein J6Z31_07530 [Fibrobacter sp.]|nr:hypothetical protein [Fibrobacter sp.]